MCLAFTGKIISIDDKAEGVVDFGQITKKVNLDLVPEVRIGQWVLVHAGFAIQKIDPDEAENTLTTLESFFT